ncbi:MAG: type IV pilus biogenesis/stability protein PilW [Gammaproteobacteria bacterium]|nr:type IV pilus biogenesis/stability protein PilW [Gammaproteobacteria bacterium]
MLSKIMKLSLCLGVICSIAACSTTKSASASAEDKKIATAKINTQLGMAYLEQHNIQRAKRKLLMALDEAPNIPDTWYSMGYFLEITGDKEQAKTYYLRSVSLAPQRGDVQNNYGTFLCRNGQYKASIEHFQLAANDINYIDTASAYENAGLCALKIPDKKLALMYFNKSLQQDPERASINLELAELNYQKGDYVTARGNLEEFLRLSPPTKESFRLSDQLNARLGEKYFSEEG